MDDLKNIAPELSKLKKENPFKVPEHYFDDFSARLQTKLEAEKMIVPAKQNRFIYYLKPALGLAASFALIFMLVYWPLKTFTPNQTANNNTDTEMSEDEGYLSIVEKMDENSFFALLYEPTNAVEFSDEDLVVYINTNITDYDIYQGTEF
jgi:hypothetical protein